MGILIVRLSRRRQNKGTGALLMFAILAMYTSAAIYWVTIVYNAFSTSAEFDKSSQPTIIEQADDGSTNKSQAIQDCVGMSTLFTNVSYELFLETQSHEFFMHR